MNVIETVAALIAQVRAARQPEQGDWVNDRGRLIAWTDYDDENRIIIAGARRTHGFAAHPAVFMLDNEERARYAARAKIALASWVLEDGAPDAMLAAGVDADYARSAHLAGVTDAWAIIDGWAAGIPVEYLAEVAS